MFIEKEWIPVIGTLAGVLVGGLISSVLKLIELIYQGRKDNNKLRLAKLEEIHAFLTDLIKEKSSYVQDIKKFHSTNPTKEELNLRVMSFAESFSKMHTKVMIYAPELQRDWTELLVSLEKLQISGFEYLDNKINSEELDSQTKKLTESSFALTTKLESKISRLI